MRTNICLYDSQSNHLNHGIADRPAQTKVSANTIVQSTRRHASDVIARMALEKPQYPPRRGVLAVTCAALALGHDSPHA
jgi:hypothetical protein